MIDPWHIVMQGLCEKLTPEDCLGLMYDSDYVRDIFYFERDNELENIECARKETPEAYSIYEQIKTSLEVAKIKDGFQIIDDKNYSQFAQTLGSFKYNGKEYNLLDVVRPITKKRKASGRIIEVRPNTPSPSQQKNFRR